MVKIELEKYPDLKMLLYKNLFNKIPVVSNKIPIGDFVFRTVPIYRNDITMGRKKYLSYRPLEYKYPFFNRCSEPEQRHFYCSTNRHLSISECSYFISESENPNVILEKSSEKLEVGMWEVKQNLYVADLRYGSYAHIGTEKHQMDIIDKYKKFVQKTYIKDFFEHINECFEVPIKKADHLQYWLTACYSNYIFDDEFTPQANWGTMDELNSKISMPLDGILYHSVKGIKTNPPLQGYNLALKTEVIDSPKIKLVKAGIFESRQVKEKEFNLDELIKHNTHIEGDSWYYIGVDEEKIN